MQINANCKLVIEIGLYLAVLAGRSLGAQASSLPAALNDA
jgi:hypothetical protein